jgi:hypothetical protein
MVEGVFIDFFELFRRQALPQIFVSIVLYFLILFKKYQAAHKGN